MKKITIVFGSLLAVFLILMIPNVNALEYNVAESTIREKISKLGLNQKVIQEIRKDPAVSNTHKIENRIEHFLKKINEANSNLILILLTIGSISILINTFGTFFYLFLNNILPIFSWFVLIICSILTGGILGFFGAAIIDLAEDENAKTKLEWILYVEIFLAVIFPFILSYIMEKNEVKI